MHVPLNGHCKDWECNSDGGFIPSGSAMGRSHVREKLGPAQDSRMTGAPLCTRALHAAKLLFQALARGPKRPLFGTEGTGEGAKGRC